MICYMIHITLTFSQCQFSTLIQSSILKETADRRCRIFPAGGLGVSLSFRSPPRLGDIRG
jgi:hypothetical protein